MTGHAFDRERGTPALMPNVPLVRRPLDIGFELSNLCNLHCTHCIRGSEQETIEHLDIGLIRRVLDQAAALFDPIAVVFTGGEPLASPLYRRVVPCVGWSRPNRAHAAARAIGVLRVLGTITLLSCLHVGFSRPLHRGVRAPYPATPPPKPARM